MGWSNGSRENPIDINIHSDISILAKFINKQKLLKRFEQIVIGDGANGPQYTLRWRQMNLFLDGIMSSKFKEELGLFIKELNTILDNDEAFSINEVNTLSDSNVHMMVTDADTFKEVYSVYENTPIEDYWGYAWWFNNEAGNIDYGRVFMNSIKMYAPENSAVVKNRVIRYTIRHELGHILGLKYTIDESSIMFPNHTPGLNDVFSDLDKEALRFLHDERMPVFSNSNDARAILEDILGIVNSSGKKKYINKIQDLDS